MQQSDGPDYLIVSAPPIRIPAMTVIGGPVAVDGNANLDAVLGEKLAKVLVKQDPVSVDPQIEAADAAQRRMELRDDPLEPATAGEQGFPAVQHHLHGAQRVRSRVVSDALSRPRDHLVRD